MDFKKILIASAIGLSSISAQALDVGVGVKAGTAGAGVDLSVAITKTINVRVFSTSFDVDDVDESFDIDSGTVGVDQNLATFDAELSADFGASGLLFDWYVFDGTFHVTAGMVRNNTKFNLDGRLTGTDITFGGITYNINQDLADNTMTGEVSFGSSYEPYIGIGWGRKASPSDPGLSLSVEFGVMLLSPSVDLNAPTLNPTSPNFNAATQQAIIDADVDAAESTANDDISDLEAWPVLSVGLNYAF